MRVYFPSPESEFNGEEVFCAVRGIFEKQLSALSMPNESLLGGRGDHEFLIQRPFGVFWGKLCFSPLTPQTLKEIQSRREGLEKSLRQEVQVNVFFVELAGNVELGIMNGAADFFKVVLMKTFGEKAMMIERVSTLKNSAPPLDVLRATAQKTDYSFSKQAHLTRNELAELIDLSLDLKRL